MLEIARFPFIPFLLLLVSLQVHNFFFVFLALNYYVGYYDMSRTKALLLLL